jgi:hypothetical protein
MSGQAGGQLGDPDIAQGTSSIKQYTIADFCILHPAATQSNKLLLLLSHRFFLTPRPPENGPSLGMIMMILSLY